MCRLSYVPAIVLKQNPDQVFRTLVTVGNSDSHYIFLVPVKKERNPKKAAKAVCKKISVCFRLKNCCPVNSNQKP